MTIDFVISELVLDNITTIADKYNVNWGQAFNDYNNIYKGVKTKLLEKYDYNVYTQEKIDRATSKLLAYSYFKAYRKGDD